MPGTSYVKLNVDAFGHRAGEYLQVDLAHLHIQQALSADLATAVLAPPPGVTAAVYAPVAPKTPLDLQVSQLLADPSSASGSLLSGVPAGGGSGAGLPTQTGNAGKFLTTDGTVVSWGTPTGGSGSTLYDSDGTPYAPVSSVSVPTQVTGLTAGTAAQSTVPLSWVASAGAASYTVQQATDGVTWTAAASGITGTSTTVSGLAAGTFYSFRVIAVNTNGSGVASVPVNATTTGAASVPGQVTGLAAGTPTSSTVPLSWTAVSGATSYKVEQSSNGGSTWTTAGTPTATSYTATGLSTATAYSFRVSAVNSTGTGTASSTVSATTAAGNTAPGAPTALTAGTPTSSTVPLSWTAPASNGGAAITDYVVQYRTTAGPGAWATFADGTSTTTSATVTGLTASTGYDFQVAAVNSVGTGAYSTTASAATSASAATFTDNFNRADGAIGNGWTVTDAAVQIVSNAVTRPSGLARGLVVRDLAAANGTITLTLGGTSGSYAGIVFRYTDSSNYWSYRSNNIFRMQAGTETAVGGANIGLTGTVQIVLNGSTINGYINGTLRHTATDTFNQTATKHGLEVEYNQTTADDFSFTAG